MYPWEDEENGHIVFKSQFIKDTNAGEELLWWAPSIEGQGRAVRMPTMNVEERKKYLLETRFRQEHGADIQRAHEAALTQLGPSGYLEKRLDDNELQRHLGNMYHKMQQAQGKLPGTSIFMKRLRYFPLSSTEIAAGEPPLSQLEVQ
jgi:hypothetical protein